MDLSNNDTEIPDDQLEEYMRYNWMRKILYADQRQKKNHMNKVHPWHIFLVKEFGPMCWTRTIFNLRLWNVEEIDSFSSSWKSSASKRRWSGSILANRKSSPGWFCVFSSLVWRGGRAQYKNRFQYCADSSGTILYFRGFLGHSGRNLIDFKLQENITGECKKSERFLRVHLSHRMCH